MQPLGSSRWSRRQVVQDAGVAGLGLLAGCGRLPGQASAAQMRQVGWLTPGAPTEAQADAFQQGLREHGYVEGQNVAVH